MKTLAAPWRNGRLDRRSLPGKILFGRVYEDALVDLEAHHRAERVFCIASAGCTALRLAARHKVTAVDINPAQLAYARRRAAGGPMVDGSVERLLSVARSALFVIGWSSDRMEEFCSFDDPEKQMQYWRANLDTLRFRSVTNALLSSPILSIAYRPELVAAVPPGFGEVIRQRLARCWSLHPNRSNPYVRALLLGEREHLPVDTAAAASIRFINAEAAEFLEGCPPDSFDGFSISNILDGATTGYRKRLFRAIARAGSEKSRVVTRSFAAPGIGASSASNFASADRCPIWGTVDIHYARDLA